MLTGYGVIPACIGFTEDDTWGRAGGHRIPQMAGNILKAAGPQGFDQIVVREENKYWRWQVNQFSMHLYFTTLAQGEWFCEDNRDGTISVKWIYTFSSRNIFLYPVTLIFVKVFWLGLQRKAIASMKAIAESDAPFLYD
jgi:hypothetical protein